ncbi:hypothetical protein ZHAS_00006285 [Anopheles sinensis]|uniref:Uncharacterized protein n=1 Tax=Anopheles sinensis TaxID=74873 RepID=A0A084VLF8_ANOSI|nr:hypothetical protein ZHAS_00006285 [Anopheles sinensis]
MVMENRRDSPGQKEDPPGGLDIHPVGLHMDRNPYTTTITRDDVELIKYFEGFGMHVKGCMASWRYTTK